MAIVNGYTDRLTIKQQLGFTGTEKDLRIDALITAVSRWIDSECETTFAVQAGQTRYYTPSGASSLRIDDFTALTMLATDQDGDGVYETTWAATDYQLEPVNARSSPVPLPYRDIQMSLNGRYAFPSGISRGAKVIGNFGFDTTIPPLITEICILQVARLFRRADAPFGITGSAEMGQSVIIGRLDPDVRSMLCSPYNDRRWHVA